MSIRTLFAVGVMGGLALVACVTINVYFPAAAAEKAADTIIKDVWGARPQPPAPVPEPESRSYRAPVLGAILEALVPAAHAQADLEIATPAIDKLKASMKARHQRLAEFYDLGAVGLTGDGLVSIRDAKLAPLNRRGELQQLVEEENRDREALYAEIANANGHPEWREDIRATFASRWVQNARSGWWYSVGGGWQQKP
jgi:uncharacterized protein YdbL (DUF1318 family)